jgi:hypothetical protein
MLLVLRLLVRVAPVLLVLLVLLVAKRSIWIRQTCLLIEQTRRALLSVALEATLVPAMTLNAAPSRQQHAIKKPHLDRSASATLDQQRHDVATNHIGEGISAQH